MWRRLSVGWRTTLACAALLLAFAALSGSAVATKSPTLDEPVHALSGWLALREGYYRLEVTNAPLWKLWAALGNATVGLPLPRTGPLWAAVEWRPSVEMPWSRQALFQTGGVDGAAFVNHSRAMMLLLGVGLGAAVAGWAYRLAGPVAAVVATALFAFDPTLLAHAPLVKGDVASGLTLVAVAWLTWRYGRRATVATGLGLAAACAAAINVKLSGLIAAPVVAGLLAIRAIGPTAWPAFGRSATTRAARLAVAAAVMVAAGAMTFTLIWASYRFRYSPAADPALQVDTAAVFAFADAEHVGLLGGACRWADAHRLLPQAFTAGVLNQAANLQRWPAYLDGERYEGGRAAYYPLTVAYKTPLAGLAAYAAAAAVGLVAGLGRSWRQRPESRWAVACVAGPAVAFAAAAVTAPANLGLRNLVPLVALVDVAIGCAAAWAYHRRPTVAGVVAVAVGVALAVTAVSAWPDYLPFFNRAAGGPVAGRGLLADANLDWGQDVPALVAWQRAHPSADLYVDLFAAVDPAFYGLRCHKLWERTADNRPVLHLPPGPAVLAVSATQLQGLYVAPEQWPLLSRLARQPPREVLHGTIYLFDYRPPPA